MPDGHQESVASEDARALERRLMPLAIRMAIASFCFFLLMFLLWITRS